MYLPEGGQLIRLPNGQMQVITPTPTQVQQPTNQGLILVSRSNQQVKKTKVIICTNIYGVFQIFSQIFEIWCNSKLFQVKNFRSYLYLERTTGKFSPTHSDFRQIPSK